jgi:putative ABC transport system permease protein
MFGRERKSEDFTAEIDAHLQLEAERLQEQGLSADEARAAARRAFGNVTQTQELFYEAGRWLWWDKLWKDIRFAARMLEKHRGFSFVAVLTLAVGIGATTALFSVVEAVLLKPLPYYQADRLAVVWTDNSRQELHEERTSYPNFEDWRNRNASFVDMAFASAFTVNLTAGEEPERVVAGRVSASVFPLMGVKPILGRTFSSEEEIRADRVIILSQGLWISQFGSSPEAVGKSLEVDGIRMAIVGVMPATFQFPVRNVELWEPLTVFPGWSELRTRRNIPSGFVVGRLKRNVSFSQAQADMNVVGANLAKQYPELSGDMDFLGFGVNVEPLTTYATGREVRVSLLLLFAVVVLVLFISCTNVASLLLSRGAARSREFATRSALGAAKLRLVCQLLIESTVLYTISGALGIAFAAAADSLLIGLAPPDIPRLHEAGINSVVLSFALLLSLMTALIFGLFPAMRISETDPHLAMNVSGPKFSQTFAVVRLRSFLVTGELALAVCLLVGAGLLMRSFLGAQGVDPGFRSDHVLTARVVQAKLKSETEWKEFYEQALESIKAIPGVEAVGAIDNFFFVSFPDERVIVDGGPTLPLGTALPQVTDDGISPGYFSALGVPLLRGRFFTEADTASSPHTAIINAAMSHRFWPDDNPVGKRFKFAYQTAAAPWTTVVGVVGDMHRDGVTRDSVSEIFLPLSQHPARGMDFVVRTSADPHSFVPAVRRAMRSVDKTAPLFNVSTLDDILRYQMAARRFQTLLLTLFAALAVFLSAIGLYGLIHYSVTQRTHEIGIRIALGAQPLDVIRLVLEQGGKIVVLGIVVGFGAALSFGRVVGSLLFGVRATDPLTFMAVTVFLCLVALAASYIPARRATRVDPMVALRYE